MTVTDFEVVGNRVGDNFGINVEMVGESSCS